MKTTPFVLVFLVGFATAACSKKDDKGGAVAGDPCETAINQAIDGMLAKGNKEAQAPTPMIEIANKLRTIMIGRCKADGWSESSLACFRAATDQPGIKACRQALPQEQSQRLQQEIMKVMTGGPGGMGGGGGAPPHGGGAMGGGAPGGNGGGAAPAGSAAAPSGSAPAGSANYR